MKVRDLAGKSSPTMKDAIARHGITADQLVPQLELGIQTELEHTNAPRKARGIALDHLMELPDYYSRLARMKQQ